MPDVALFEPLCKELEISIPELLSGRRIDAEDQQQTAEQLLMESISMRKLIGLSVFLQLNSIIGVLLVISPFLFHPERPLNLLLVALGLVECAMVVYFDSTLPGKETRRQSLTVRFVYTICLFLTIAAINYPASVRESVPLTTEILVFLIPCVLALLIQFFIWRYREDRDDAYLFQFPTLYTMPSRIVWDISTIAFLKNPGWTPSRLVDAPVLNNNFTWGPNSGDGHKIRVVNFIYRDPIFGDMIACLTK